MLLYDNASDQRRVIILATSDNLTILAESSSWYLDGTFKSSPQLFYQILILHAELPSLTDDRSWCLPTVYILLTHKDSAIYLEAFQSLVSNCPILAPQVLMLDFEQALRSSLSSTFPSALVDGCHFHFCQAVLRNLYNLGYKTQYETVTTDPATGFKEHSLVHTWVRRLMMLAMVPVSDVPDAFAAIADSIPDTLDLDSFLGYFERTWVSGVSGRRARFPPETWNQSDRVETGMGRTNNFCESFNKTFSDVVGHSNPTIYNFISAVQLEQSSTEGKITSYRQGRQPPARKKRWVEKDAAIKRIVGNYHLYENRLMEFLDELAQL